MAWNPQGVRAVLLLVVAASLVGCLDEQPYQKPGRFTWAELEACPAHVGCPVEPTLSVSQVERELMDGWTCDEDAAYRHCAQLAGCGEAIAFGARTDTRDSGVVIAHGSEGGPFWTWERAVSTRFVVMPYAGMDQGELRTYRVEYSWFPPTVQVVDVSVAWGDKDGAAYPMYRVESDDTTYWFDVAQRDDAGGQATYRLPAHAYVDVEGYNVDFRVEGREYAWESWQNPHHAAC